jgi:drug/metabolite transporter (DMT)-like permease
VVAGLILAVILDTFIQIAWKLAVAPVPPSASVTATLRAVLGTPLFYAAMVAFGAQLWNWLRVLTRADLSFAQPFTALSYLSVLAISWYSLHEPISSSRLVGVVFILAGVFFISRTPFRTAGDGGRDPASSGPSHP